MKRILGTFAVLAAAVLGTSLVLAASHSETMTVTGELVDLACYLNMGEKGAGEAHAECAKKCAKGGAPMGVKAEDGKLYLLVADHEKQKAYEHAKDHCGQKVEVTGKHVMQGDLHGLAVHEVKKAA